MHTSGCISFDLGKPLGRILTVIPAHRMRQVYLCVHPCEQKNDHDRGHNGTGKNGLIGVRLGIQEVGLHAWRGHQSWNLPRVDARRKNIKIHVFERNNVYTSEPKMDDCALAILSRCPECNHPSRQRTAPHICRSHSSSVRGSHRLTCRSTFRRMRRTLLFRPAIWH